MSKHRLQSGQALLIVALAMPMLFGMIGLAVDVGYMEFIRRLAQTAADAGAMGAVAGLPFGHWSDGALDAAAANGFRNGVNGVTVTPHNPPSTGAYHTSTNAVEVIVSQSVPTFFLKMIGIGNTSVLARAVASSGAGDCVFALNTSAANALTVPFFADINTPGCGITVNSSSSSALSGFLGFFTARTIGVVGGWSNCFLCSFSPTPVNLPAPANDPLAYLTKPAVAACAGTAKNITGPGNYTVNPALGCYNVNITGSIGTNVTLMPGEYSSITINSVVAPAVTFQPGTYIIQGVGGLNLTGVGASMGGTGVTIYMGPAAGSLTVNGVLNTLNFIAPTTGTYAGILFFQDPLNTHAACVGGCSGTITGLLNGTFVQGALYFPKATLSFNGCCQFTAYTITVADKLSFIFDYFGDDYSSLPGGSPIKRTLLVE